MTPNICAGNMSLKDKERHVCSSEVNNGQLKAIIEANTFKITREVAEEINLSYATLVCHLRQVGKVNKLDKWVPHGLSEAQKNHRSSIFLVTTLSYVSK